MHALHAASKLQAAGTWLTLIYSFTVSSAPNEAMLIQSELAIAAMFAAVTFFPCISDLQQPQSAPQCIFVSFHPTFFGRSWQVPNYKGNAMGNAMAFQGTAQELRKSINGPTY